MSDASTKRMIQMYMETAPAPMYLSSFFQSPQENFHMSEKVEFDVQRDGRDVAVVITDLSGGARRNEANKYTNKEFVPPIYNEQGAVNAMDLLKRVAGQLPFTDPNVQAAAIAQAFKVFNKLTNKIRRAIELMSSQVLQTGKLTLKDQNGNSLYVLDFGPKSTHFPTAANDWTGTSDKLKDLEDLADVIRADGKMDPFRLTFGKSAWRTFIADSDVQAQLDNRRIMTGEVNPQKRSQGATQQGYCWIGNYLFELWTYNASYTDPQTGDDTPYITEDLVVMDSGGRLDLTYGGIPRLAPPESRALPFMPPRMSDSEQRLDLTTNAWMSEDGTHVNVTAGTRPLTIPTAIDTFGALNTVA